MDERELTRKYANVPAFIHKMRNWEITEKKRCVFDMYVKKLSTGDTITDDEDVQYTIRFK